MTHNTDNYLSSNAFTKYTFASLSSLALLTVSLFIAMQRASGAVTSRHYRQDDAAKLIACWCVTLRHSNCLLRAISDINRHNENGSMPSVNGWANSRRQRLNVIDTTFGIVVTRQKLSLIGLHACCSMKMAINKPIARGSRDIYYRSKYVPVAVLQSELHTYIQSYNRHNI